MLNLVVDDVSLWGVFLIILTVIMQGVVAATVKAKAIGAVPGKIDADLSHDSLIFRSHRTFHNSLENVPWMLATCFLAFFSNVDAFWLSVYIWVFAVARIIHMVLYYVIATEKNPSPRSIFFLIALVANMALLTNIAVDLL
tara:strand:- start:93793 stop:94215 length:423 start_codon:yes stop_codon:yes gene_type:complete